MRMSTELATIMQRQRDQIEATHDDEEQQQQQQEEIEGGERQGEEDDDIIQITTVAKYVEDEPLDESSTTLTSQEAAMTQHAEPTATETSLDAIPSLGSMHSPVKEASTANAAPSDTPSSFPVTSPSHDPTKKTTADTPPSTVGIASEQDISFFKRDGSIPPEPKESESSTYSAHGKGGEDNMIHTPEQGGHEPSADVGVSPPDDVVGIKQDKADNGKEPPSSVCDANADASEIITPPQKSDSESVDEKKPCESPPVSRTNNPPEMIPSTNNDDRNESMEETKAYELPLEYDVFTGGPFENKAIIPQNPFVQTNNHKPAKKSAASVPRDISSFGTSQDASSFETNPSFGNNSRDFLLLSSKENSYTEENPPVGNDAIDSVEKSSTRPSSPVCVEENSSFEVVLSPEKNGHPNIVEWTNVLEPPTCDDSADGMLEKIPPPENDDCSLVLVEEMKPQASACEGHICQKREEEKELLECRKDEDPHNNLPCSTNPLSDDTSCIRSRSITAAGNTDSLSEKRKYMDIRNYPMCLSLQQRYQKIEPHIAIARTFAGNIVNNERVQLFIIAMIAINGIMLGIATFDFVTKNAEVMHAFEVTDEIFLSLFTVELALQFIYHGWHLFVDGWLVFDFVIIMMSYAFADLQIVRAFRIFRVLRLVTRVEVMRDLMTALFSVFPGMASIALLLSLIFYIFAVMFTSMFKDLFDEGYLEYDYFGNIWASLFTCFQFVTLDDFNPIIREVMVARSWAWFPFFVYVIVSGFVVVNLLIAVICDAVSAMEDINKKKLTAGFYNIANRKFFLPEESDVDEEDDERNMYYRLKIGRDKKSQKILNDVLNTGRHEIAKKVDEMENQVQDLIQLQKQGTESIEIILRRLQQISNNSDNDVFVNED
mmetsp:Transcript_29233/g.44210  ORF Transcript_29233/g.44210 Transcript_29233/m.44210 type:complete len:886 (+) Transcript_29233:60-2717(+)